MGRLSAPPPPTVNSCHLRLLLKSSARNYDCPDSSLPQVGGVISKWCLPLNLVKTPFNSTLNPPYWFSTPLFLLNQLRLLSVLHSTDLFQTLCSLQKSFITDSVLSTLLPQLFRILLKISIQAFIRPILICASPGQLSFSSTTHITSWRECTDLPVEHNITGCVYALIPILHLEGFLPHSRSPLPTNHFLALNVL